MEACWNKLVMDRPPTMSWRCMANEFDFTGFLKVIEEVQEDLKSQGILRTEAALLSRLIYRMKSKLRSDKGLKNMEKVNRALLNYLRLSLESDYKYLGDNAECTENLLVLPSRQMLQYVLVRTQGFAKLMCRIENVAERSGDYFKSRISLGHSWNMSLVAYAVISRIWFLSRSLIKKCCLWYSRLYKYHDKLNMIGLSWLPENYRFPVDMKLWLEVPWINEPIGKILQEEGLPDSIFNLLSQHENIVDGSEFVAEGTDISTSVNPPFVQSVGIESPTKRCGAPESVLQTEMSSKQHTGVEIGKHVSRDAFEASRTSAMEGFARNHTEVRSKKKRVIVTKGDAQDINGIRLIQDKMTMKSHTHGPQVLRIDNIRTNEDLMEFLKIETYPGVEKLHWNMIRKNTHKLLNKLYKRYDASDSKEHSLLLKKVIRSLRVWMN